MGAARFSHPVALRLAVLVLAFHVLPCARAADSPDAELHAAVRAGDVERVRTLLKAGAPPSERNSLGSTPLHDAAWAGDLQVMKEFIDAGAALEAQHKETGSTPLHYAVITNHAN